MVGSEHTHEVDVQAFPMNARKANWAACDHADEQYGGSPQCNKGETRKSGIHYKIAHTIRSCCHILSSSPQSPADYTG